MGSTFDFGDLLRLLEAELATNIGCSKKRTFQDLINNLADSWDENNIKDVEEAVKKLSANVSSKAPLEIKRQLGLVKEAFKNKPKGFRGAMKQHKLSKASCEKEAEKKQERESGVHHLESVLQDLTKICKDNGINTNQTAKRAVSPKPGNDKDDVVRDKIHVVLESLKETLDQLSMQAGTKKIGKASERRVAQEGHQKEERETLTINLLREELVCLKADIENWDKPLDGKQFVKLRKEISDCEDSDFKLCANLRVNINDIKQDISKQNEEIQKSIDSLRQELQKLQSELDDWDKNTGSDDLEKLLKKEEKPVGQDAELCRTLRSSLSKKKEVIGKQMEARQDKDKSIDSLRQELQKLQCELDDWDKNTGSDDLEKLLKKEEKPVGQDAELCRTLRSSLSKKKEVIGKQMEARQDKDKSIDSLRQELQKLQSELDDWDKNTGSDDFEKVWKREGKPVGQDAQLCRTLRYSLSKKKEVIGKKMEAHQIKNNSIDSLRQELQKLQCELDDWDKNTGSDDFEKLLKKEDKPVGQDAELCRTLRSSLSKKKEDTGKKMEKQQKNDKSVVSLHKELQNLESEIDDMDKNADSQEFVKLLEKEDKPVGLYAESCRRLRANLSQRKQGIRKRVGLEQERYERLSAVAGTNLRKNNPNITDLSDPNRPTRLAEEFSDLYDNQWTDAYDCIVKSSKEKTDGHRNAIDALLTILKESFLMCKEVSGLQLSLLNTTILRPTTSVMEGSVPQQTGKKLQKGDRQEMEISVNDRTSSNLSPVQSAMMHDIRKGTADISINDLQQKKNYYMTHRQDKWFNMEPVKAYTQRCVELCWRMNLQSPPVHMDLSLQPGQTINKEAYRHYTRSGEKVEFVCWPALYLSEEGGGQLLKGVVQGTLYG